MASTPASSIRPSDILHTVLAHPLRLLVPTIAATLLGVVAVVVRPATWEATQAMTVRDEAGGSRLSRPGKFDHADAMKSVQETILELSHSHGVLAAALQEVGPPADAKDAAEWPTTRDVEALADACKLAPPKGAEFGKTEVFYLKVQASSKTRAVALASAVSHHLQARFEELRKSRAESVTNELLKSVSLAETDLETSTAALSAMERSVGRDLAELRILNESPSGDSDLRRMALELEAELRTQKAALHSSSELLNLLKQAETDPGRLLATPSRLLEGQAGLKRLKDGLVDSQLATAKLEGSLASEHPLLKAAKVAELEIAGHLHDELILAVKGLEMDVRLAQTRVQRLEEQLADLNARRDRVANLRAEYANLVSVTRHRTEILKTAQLELSEARATEAAAQRVNLISLVDGPETGSRPAGPGRTTIVLMGLVAGLVMGAGLIFLTVEGSNPSGGPGVDELLHLEVAKARRSAKQGLGKLGKVPAVWSSRS